MESIHLRLYLRTNCSACYLDGASLIFSIVNMVTRLSKRSENEKE